MLNNLLLFELLLLVLRQPGPRGYRARRRRAGGDDRDGGGDDVHEAAHDRRAR